jgi:hypothetical protein
VVIWDASSSGPSLPRGQSGGYEPFGSRPKPGSYLIALTLLLTPGEVSKGRTRLVSYPSACQEGWIEWRQRTPAGSPGLGISSVWRISRYRPAHSSLMESPCFFRGRSSIRMGSEAGDPQSSRILAIIPVKSATRSS